MGGVFIQSGVAGGTQSLVARRRLTIHHDAQQPIAFEWLYEADATCNMGWAREGGRPVCVGAAGSRGAPDLWTLRARLVGR